MSLDDKLTAPVILKMSGIALDPGYYSGRRATTTDLDDRKLEIIYQSVLRGHGKDAAQGFAILVKAIPTLAAADFILAFLRLEANGWKWNESLLGNERGAYLVDLSQAFATVANTLSTVSDRDETDAIRGPFLIRHAAEYQIRVAECPQQYK